MSVYSIFEQYKCDCVCTDSVENIRMYHFKNDLHTFHPARVIRGWMTIDDELFVTSFADPSIITPQTAITIHEESVISPWPASLGYGPVKWDAFPYMEGTLIRVFVSSRKPGLFISTHRAINAFSSSNFGERLLHALNLDLGTLHSLLEVDVQYLFLLTAQGDQCVASPEQHPLYFIGTKPLRGGRTDFNASFRNVPKPPRVTDVFQACRDLERGERYPGLILFNGSRVYKVLHQDYLRHLDLRGDTPDIRMRLLQLLDIEYRRQELIDRYPILYEFNQELDTLANYLYHAFVNRYFKKKFTVVPGDLYPILKHLAISYFEERPFYRKFTGFTILHVYRALSNDSDRVLKYMEKQE